MNFNKTITPNGNGWQYEYTIADHLGNARISFADVDKNGSNDLVRMSMTPKLRDTFLSSEGLSLIGKLLPILFSERPKIPSLWDIEKKPGLLKPWEPKW